MNKIGKIEEKHMPEFDLFDRKSALVFAYGILQKAEKKYSNKVFIRYTPEGKEFTYTYKNISDCIAEMYGEICERIKKESELLGKTGKLEENAETKTYRPIIAIDFDGTLCTGGGWPGIGEPRHEIIEAALKCQEEGAFLILWTNRTGDQLAEAVAWCKDRGIVFDAVNENLPNVIDHFGGDTRKIYANEYWDDRAVKV